MEAVIAFKKHKPSFPLLEYHLSVFEQFTNRKLPPIKRFSVQAKISYSGMRRAIQDQFELSNQEMKGLVLYAFIYDPLNLPIFEYGKFEVIAQCANSFSKWLRTNKDEIETCGLLTTLRKYDPGYAQLQSREDSFYAEIMDRFQVS